MRHLWAFHKTLLASCAISGKLYIFFPDFGSTKFQKQMLNQAYKENDIIKEAFLFQLKNDCSKE